jgi:hypothetical protein
MTLPKDYAARKALPLYDVYTKYFPRAQIELVKVAVVGNEQHNPGEPLHWARGKSMDQLNTAMRHMLDHALGNVYDDDPAVEITRADGTKFYPSHRTMHLAKAMWRLGAAIELLCEAEVAPTKRAQIAALCEIDKGASADEAWRAASTWAFCKLLRWFQLDRLLGVTSARDHNEYARSEPPPMRASEAALRAAWGAP